MQKTQGTRATKNKESTAYYEAATHLTPTPTPTPAPTPTPTPTPHLTELVQLLGKALVRVCRAPA